MLRKFYVNKDERALLFREGDFVTILDAGKHTLWDPLRRLSWRSMGSLSRSSCTVSRTFS
jgi:hypothetical protein